MNDKILYKEESFNIVGAAIEVHKVLGCGFTEPVYQDAFEQELKMRKIPYEREKVFNINYKGSVLDKTFRVDFVCYNKIIVELKAVTQLADEHFAQVYNYLKVTNMKLGILLNFGEKSLDSRRIPCTKKWK